MAIAFDAVVSATANFLTWSHTCSGSNRILFVHVINVDVNVPSACTYGGVSMTKLTDNGTTQSVFYLINPATGSNTVAVTSASSNCFCQSISYNNALQTGQPDSSAKSNSSSPPQVVATTVVNSNCWLIAFGYAWNPQTGLTTGQTFRSSGAPPYGGYAVITDSNGSVSTGSNSITFTPSGGSTWVYGYLVSISPALIVNSGGDFFAFF